MSAIETLFDCIEKVPAVKNCFGDMFDKARAELAELQADRERLEFHEANPDRVWLDSDGVWNRMSLGHMKTYDTFRAAIDDAMKEAPDAEQERD